MENELIFQLNDLGNFLIIQPIELEYEKYVVIRTKMFGGGTPYPDGYKVTCQRMNDENIIVSFYMVGHFKDIKPIGKAKAKWEIIDDK